MSLVEELRGLDVSRIVAARGSLASAVDTTDVKAVAGRGNSAAVLGDLGRGLESLKSDFTSAESLLRPLVDVLGRLAPELDASHLPIARYAEVVREGATTAAEVLHWLNDHPSNWGGGGGASLGNALKLVGGKAGELGDRLGRPAQRYAELLRVVENPPTSPQALARLALEVILPFPQQGLASLRDETRKLAEAAGRITLPSGRTAGLIAAFDLVTATAAKRDTVQLEAALRELERARRQTIVALEDDLRFVAGEVQRIRIPQALRPLIEVSQAIRAGREGVIEFMSDLTGDLADIRAQVENVEIDRVREFIRGLPDILERQAREAFEKPIDQMVARAAEFVRDASRRLGVRQYRAQVGQFIHEIADRIERANLDGPANLARGALADASRLLTSSSLADQIGAEMQRLNASMKEVLDRLEGPLNTIAAEVDALADRAVVVLDRATDALVAFQTAIDQLQRSIEHLGLHEREQQIVDALRNLRQKAENLLSNVPLPEQVRPRVEDLIETLGRIDFTQLMQPVRDAAAQIQIPDDVAEAVQGGLEEARRVIENLIPQQLIETISRDVEQALASIRAFDPASLAPDLSSYLEEAAAAIERLDPRQIAESIRGPYQTVLDLVDRAHPEKLLRPVIEVYDSLIGNIPAPNPVSVTQSLGEALDGAGRVVGRALVAPLSRVTHDAQTEVDDPAVARPVEIPVDLGDVRAGDAIRILGYLPAKLRDALRAVQGSAAGEVLHEIDSCCAGLARQLREVPDALAVLEQRLDRGVDTLLAPVATAQARAQLAIYANFSADRLTVHLDPLAAAGPASLRRDLSRTLGIARDALRDTATAAGRAKQAFDRAADALERSPLASLSGNLDGLLAVLDPEPIAREMDLIMSSVVQKSGTLFRAIEDDVRAAVARVRGIVSELNPMALAQRFLSVLDVVREELDVLNPRRLAIELAEIHTVIREVIEAYDPRLIAQDLARLSREVAQQIRALNPQQLLGNLDFWRETVDRVATLNPAKRLQEVGAALRPLGERLGAIDLQGLIRATNQIAPELLDAFEAMLEAIRNETVALLESLRFSTGSASASVRAA